MTTLTTLIDNFVASQNQNRGQPGEEVALDYDALTTTVPSGGNSVSGIATIAAGASTLALGAGANVLILEGAHSSIPGTGGQPDSFAISTDANGNVTLLDENTQQVQVVTGVNYLVFNGGATNASGGFQSIVMVEGGQGSEVAELYNAALGRLPDLAGVEYYQARLADGEQTLQQQAANFIASPEFQSRFAAATLPGDNGGPNDAAFVTALYQNVLHRTPAASELAYYVAALHNGEVGSVVDQTNPVVWTRAQELINFAASPENAADISGWLINTSSGAHADAGFALPGTASVTSVIGATSGGIVDTGSINPSTITGGYTEANGGWNNSGSGGITIVSTLGYPTSPAFSGGGVLTSENNVTIELSANFPNAEFYGATNSTIYSAPAGHGLFIYQYVYDTHPTSTTTTETILEGAGDVLYLSGTGNLLLAAGDSLGGGGTGLTHNAPNALVVYGANAGDLVEFNNHHGAAPGATAPQVDIIETPAAGTMIQGSSFISPTYGTGTATPAGKWFPITTIAINVGTVSDNSAATMAAAAAKVYQPTTTNTGNADFGQEEIVFFGQGANNDTVVYKWFADNTHTISATTMVAGLDLIGVSPTQFESMLKF